MARLNPSRQPGFTLIELVVALVLTAIVIGFAVMFLAAPVDTYFAQTRRADLVESADAIKRTMTDDLRHALPNSIRIRISGTRAIVEMLRVVGEPVFYDDILALTPDPDRQLDFSTADVKFMALGKFGVAVGAGDHLVIGNTGTNAGPGTGNAYIVASNRVITPNGTQVAVAAASATEDQVQLNPGGFQFRVQSPTKRMFLVRTPVSYICNTAANVRMLRRYQDYPIRPGIPMNEGSPQLAGAKTSVIARDVSSCTLRCANGVTPPCKIALVVDIAVARAANGGNEVMHVLTEHPLDDDNMP